MKEKTLANLLEENRTIRKISKTNLCRGLCTVTALARYEKDGRIPDKFLVDALLERLGLSPFKYEFITSEEEFSFSMQRNKINNHLWRGEYKLAMKEVKEYRRKITPKQKLHVQYLLLVEGQIRIKEANYPKATKLLKEALSCTGSEKIFEEGIGKLLLTDIEMKICYDLAECLYLQNRSEGFLLFKELKRYIKTMTWDNEKKKEYYPRILYRLALSQAQIGNMGSMVRYLIQAEELMIREYKIEHLYEVLELKREAYRKLEIELPKDNEDFITALKMIAISDKGKITEEGMKLWESTANQQL